jgi:hypothetical protein
MIYEFIELFGKQPVLLFFLFVMIDTDWSLEGSQDRFWGGDLLLGLDKVDMPLQVGLHPGDLSVKNLGLGIIGCDDLVLGVPVFGQDMHAFDDPIAHQAVNLKTGINGDLTGLLVPFVPFGKKEDGLVLLDVHRKDFNG